MQQSFCELRAKITPESEINRKNYDVSCITKTEEKCIQETKCHDCFGSEMGCRHAVAFRMWVHRRSEQHLLQQRSYMLLEKIFVDSSFNNKEIQNYE